MEDASISQTTTDPWDELTDVVRYAIACLPVQWQQLQLDEEIDQEEIEGIMSGERRATPRVAHVLAYGLGRLATDICTDLEVPIWKALQRVYPPAASAGWQLNDKGWKAEDSLANLRQAESPSEAAEPLFAPLPTAETPPTHATLVEALREAFGESVSILDADLPFDPDVRFDVRPSDEEGSTLIRWLQEFVEDRDGELEPYTFGGHAPGLGWTLRLNRDLVLRLCSFFEYKRLDRKTRI